MKFQDEKEGQENLKCKCGSKESPKTEKLPEVAETNKNDQSQSPKRSPQKLSNKKMNRTT